MKYIEVNGYLIKYVNNLPEEELIKIISFFQNEKFKQNLPLVGKGFHAKCYDCENGLVALKNDIDLETYHYSEFGTAKAQMLSLAQNTKISPFDKFVEKLFYDSKRYSLAPIYAYGSRFDSLNNIETNDPNKVPLVYTFEPKMAGETLAEMNFKNPDENRQKICEKIKQRRLQIESMQCEQLAMFFKNYVVISSAYNIDANENNFLYDKIKGFYFLDITLLNTELTDKKEIENLANLEINYLLKYYVHNTVVGTVKYCKDQISNLICTIKHLKNEINDVKKIIPSSNLNFDSFCEKDIDNCKRHQI